MNENRLIRLLITITSSLILLNIVNYIVGMPSWQITRFIHLGFEGNAPTWFSSIILAVAAFFAYKCSIIVKTRQEGKRMWQFLSLGLLAMSCDETAQVHDAIGIIIRKYTTLNGIAHTSWIAIGPFVLLFVLLFVIKIKKYLIGSDKANKYLGLGAVLFIYGAFVIESTINYLNHENLQWLWNIENIIEESFEMFGIILIIKGLMEYHKTIKQKYTAGIKNLQAHAHV